MLNAIVLVEICKFCCEIKAVSLPETRVTATPKIFRCFRIVSSELMQGEGEDFWSFSVGIDKQKKKKSCPFMGSA